MALQGQASDVERMQPVDILLRTDQVNDFLLVQMHRQRQLNEHAAYLRVFLELAYLGHKLSFTSIRSKLITTISDADLVACPEL